MTDPAEQRSIVRETRPTYRAPGTSRRYLSKHGAYIAWAKAIIFSHCECDRGPFRPEDPPGGPCDLHHRLFYTKARQGDVEGWDIGDRGPLIEVYDSTRYTLVRDRLVRWLKWRDRRRAELADD